MTSALAYLRTSSATNVGEDKDTHVRQMAAIQRYADAHGLVIVLPPFYDAAVSGVDLVETRPGFAAMLAHIDSSGVRIVLVEDESRFARDVVTQELGIRELLKRGVTLITASGTVLTDDSDPTRTFHRQLVASMNQLDKARIVARLKSGRDRASAALGRRVEGGQPNPDLLAAVKSLKASQPDLTLREISAKLAEQGFVTRSGKQLGTSHIRHLLMY